MTSIGKHAVVGAGPVGTETARLLADAGHEVVVVTRSGARPDISGVGKVAADASDADTLTRLTLGATALYNCANPADYTSWERVWPPLADGLLTAAESSGATLVTASSLYGYGPYSEPIVEVRRIVPPTGKAGSAPTCGPRPDPATRQVASARWRCGARTT